jgi:hypothetical protein
MMGSVPVKLKAPRSFTVLRSGAKAEGSMRQFLQIQTAFARRPFAKNQLALVMSIAQKTLSIGYPHAGFRRATLV